MFDALRHAIEGVEGAYVEVFRHDALEIGLALCLFLLMVFVGNLLLDVHLPLPP